MDRLRSRALTASAASSPPGRASTTTAMESIDFNIMRFYHSFVSGSAALAAVAAASAFPLPAQAGPVTELEANGAAINNTIGTAQAIPATSFTTNVSPTVFGSLPTVTTTGAGGGNDID